MTKSRCEIGSVCSMDRRDERHLGHKTLVGSTEQNRELCRKRIKFSDTIEMDLIKEVVCRNV